MFMAKSCQLPIKVLFSMQSWKMESIVSGESKIPYSGKRIKRVFLTPKKIKPLPETIQAIKDADLIIIGPGSLVYEYFAESPCS